MKHKVVDGVWRDEWDDLANTRDEPRVGPDEDIADFEYDEKRGEK